MTAFLRGLAMGFAIAAPVGPIGLLCIQRTLAAGRAMGLATGLGIGRAQRDGALQGQSDSVLRRHQGSIVADLQAICAGQLDRRTRRPASRHVPGTLRAIGARGVQSASVTTECYVGNRILMSYQRLANWLAGGDIPEPDVPAPIARGQQPAVGAEGDGLHLVFMTP